jgi:protein arginine N-methyltransferase 1
MYGVAEYCSMVEDRKRVEAYRNALERTITPSSVVIDLGTGIGLFAIVAARLGARHVYGIEQSELIELGPVLAKAAGVADRVTFIRGSAWEVAPPEKANVLFYDLRGNTPLYLDNHSLVSNARRRWLTPDATMFPARERLRAAVVSAHGLTRERRSKLLAVEEMGVPIAAIDRILGSSIVSDRQEPVAANEALTPPFTWATMEYGEPPPRSVSGEATLEVTSSGVANGILVWFEADLVPGVTYENGPGTKSPYSNQLLPFETDVPLSVGDAVHVTLTALTDGAEWGWSHSVRRANGETTATKRQSTLTTQLGSVADLLKESPQARPALNAEGRRRLEMLSAFDGTATTAELAARFAQDASEDAVRRAMNDVRELARRYSR